MRIAEVVFPIPLPKGYHYRVPQGMTVAPGQRVRASFGPRRTVGTVIAVFDGDPARPLKPLDSVVDALPALGAEGVACARWMSRRFGAAIGECVKALLPPFVRSLDEPASFAPAPARAAAASAFELTPGQSKALGRLEALLGENRHARVVLFGVPASGKTEVYLRLIRRAVQGGGQALFLLPEIGLTRPFFDEFSAGLGASVALWHSGLTQRERRRTWLGVRRGVVKVVVGARSACLLPFSDLRLAVLDEEQDESFKQDSNAPYYHARDVALERARSFGALAVLGSATPSLEAWDLARRGSAELVEMPERVSRLERPSVRVIAMPGFGEVLCEELVSKMKDRLARREQVILLVNRRGFSTLTTCVKCRWIDRCPDCGVAKIQHEAPAGPDGRARWTLICHHCGKEWAPAEKCGQCGYPSVRACGVGTQRVAAEVKRRLPGSRVLRMDRDTLSKERKQEQRIYDQFRERKADVLVGTKLVAKSFHFPDVTLVGVVDADTMLHMPDFRSSERTMQMLAQVAGRSGRADKPGEVLIQTLSPEHEAIRGAAAGDYAAWADGELTARRELRYPPAAALLRAILTGKDEARTAEAARGLAEALRVGLAQKAEVVGPAPALLREVRGKFRRHLLIKLPPEGVEAALAAARAHHRASTVRLTLDVDPYDMF
ncbi:MAG: primosomal protein N' [Elusimicrobia bacterium GWA2_66_18]|nr:MAG: primosomal protein N' [Elusimicrobia bacterium GWA2_66_18]